MKLLVILLFLFNVSTAKEYYTVSGFIKDQWSGEPLALANIVLKAIPKVVTIKDKD